MALPARRSRWRPALVGLGLLATAVHVQTTVLQVRAADRAGASIDWSRALLLSRTAARPDSTVTYATVAGVPLRLDVLRPPAGVRRRRVPVLQVHGGGFTGGKRTSQRADAADLARAGYTVLAIDYRLGPSPTFDASPGDVACAAAWTVRHARDLDVDPARLVLSGGSAGAALALQVAYGGARSSCGGTVPRVAAVVAYYGAVDRARRWADAGVLQKTVRRYTANFLGGPPARHPARYRETEPLELATRGAPRTLIVTGSADHVVGTAPQRALAARLRERGIAHELVVAPRADHAFNGVAPWGIPAQQARAAVRRFLAAPG